MNFKCKQCGRCCKKVVLPFKTGGDEQEWLELHGIKIVKSKFGEFIDIPLKCINLKDNKCSKHDNRPTMCADYRCDNEFSKMFI